jgi:hypothetical protein
VGLGCPIPGDPLYNSRKQLLTRRPLCPCSRNCTKHNVRCDYMDGGMVEGNPDLNMTPQVLQELDRWRETGVYPFPNLGLEHHPSPSRYSPTDLRLIHHISSIASQMQAVEPSNSAIWTKRVPMYVVSVTSRSPHQKRLIMEQQVFEDRVEARFCNALITGTFRVSSFMVDRMSGDPAACLPTSWVCFPGSTGVDRQLL